MDHHYTKQLNQREMTYQTEQIKNENILRKISMLNDYTMRLITIKFTYKIIIL